MRHGRAALFGAGRAGRHRPFGRAGVGTLKSHATTADTPHVGRSSWLSDEATRARLIDIGGEVRPMRNRAFAALGVAALLAGPWAGWWPLACLVVALGGFLVNERIMPRVARPEVTYFSAWVLAQLMIAAPVALGAGTDTWAIAWFALPVVILATRLTDKGVAVGVGTTIAIVLGAVGIAALRGQEARPDVVIAVVALVVGCGLLSVALMRSDVQHREEAVIDPLTQVLNRGALGPRAREIEAQSENHRQPVAAVIGDIDHFKALNDTLGHAAGDVALREVAYRLRASLRAYDSVYRLGGEEFLVLLPGADAEAARGVAEQLRTAVGGTEIEGRSVTMSFGVAATDPGAVFRLDPLLEAADADLYLAKGAGRDRVGGAPDHSAGSPAPDAASIEDRDPVATPTV